MLSGIVTAVAFLAALLILPRYVFGGRGRRAGRVKVRYGPTLKGQAFLGLAKLYVHHWMYTVPVTLAFLMLAIGYALTS